MSSVDNENNMLSAARSVLLYGQTIPTDEICQRIEAIEPTDLQRVAEQLFAPENISQLIYK